MVATTNSTQQASCCSTFYEQDWVRILAEDVFHPGGAELSQRTIAGMELRSGARLLDLGCGVGNTARNLPAELRLTVTGIDFSRSNLQRAVAESGNRAASFVQADAHRLPFADNSFDGALCECVMSLLLDKPAVLGEIHRILKPGGRLGITDMSVTGDLADDFAATVAPWTCLADALDRDSYVALFESAGFEVMAVADESNALTDLVSNLKRKLILIGASGLASGQMPLDIESIRYWLKRFAGEVDKGAISYLRFQLQSCER
jgi:ubiquinone/menaquinone biosynthesis C-methylase UbiE